VLVYIEAEKTMILLD